MDRTIKFTKMQGAGNDYVYINAFREKIEEPGPLAKKMSDRHFGVGSDGLVLIMPSSVADLRMRMFNADGSEAEMCGNASRCVAKYAHDHGLVSGDSFNLETGGGIRPIKLIFEDSQVVGATVDMGEPILQPSLIPVKLGQEVCVAEPLEIAGKRYEITSVSMGNPHAILFMENVSDLDLPNLGPQFECHPAFPKRTNTEFVEVLSGNRIKMRVWERGAGETLACGTGACAALVACVLNGLTDRAAAVELPGGVLQVEWSPEDNHVLMSGPAKTVFDGEYFL